MYVHVSMSSIDRYVCMLYYRSIHLHAFAPASVGGFKLRQGWQAAGWDSCVRNCVGHVQAWDKLVAGCTAGCLLRYISVVVVVAAQAAQLSHETYNEYSALGGQ